MQDANLSKLYLFGGAVLDPLLNKNAKINDYDVCVKDEEDFYTGINALREKGYNVADVVKTHNIYVVIKNPNGMQLTSPVWIRKTTAFSVWKKSMPNFRPIKSLINTIDWSLPASGNSPGFQP